MNIFGSDPPRPGVLYALNVRDHRTGQVVEGDYIGKTRQALAPGCNLLDSEVIRRAVAARLSQHEDEKAYGDRIVSAYPFWAGMVTDGQLDRLEMAAIAKYAPRLNDTGNRGNLRRIPIYTQEEQRWQRDDAARLPRWVHPRDRMLTGARVIVDRPAWLQRVHAVASRVRVVHAYIAAWLLLWGMCWRHFVEAGGDAAVSAGVSAVPATLLLGAGIRVGHPGRQARRRGRRSTERRRRSVRGRTVRRT